MAGLGNFAQALLNVTIYEHGSYMHAASYFQLCFFSNTKALISPLGWAASVWPAF